MKIICNIFLLFVLSISIRNEITVIGYGSSSLFFMKDAIDSDLGRVTYINLAKSGEIIETMAALQGANLVSIKFKEVGDISKSKKYNVDILQKYNFGFLKPKGAINVKLDNDVYGELDLRKGTFKYTGIDRKITKNKIFDVDFGFSELAKNSISIICVGKNNIVGAKYSAEQVAKYIDLMTQYLSMHGNNNFIVCGNFVDRGSSLTSKKTILKLNTILKSKYQDKYFDMQDYLMSEDIWEDLSIYPTTTDLAMQAKGELPSSLSRDQKHLTNEVYRLMVKRLKFKLRDLSYL